MSIYTVLLVVALVLFARDMVDFAIDAKDLAVENSKTRKLRRQKIKSFLTGSDIRRMRILRKYKNLFRRKDILHLLVELSDEDVVTISCVHLRLFELCAEFPLLSLKECKYIFRSYDDNPSFEERNDLFEILQSNCKHPLFAKDSLL